EQELMLAVLKLPKKQRVVVHLYYYEEFSVREIARLMHISENAVKKRMSRARETLRILLKEEPFNE
ncbi:MAG: RNA polymerase subunit sigma, partial [Clostridiales bacterium]|nr:RNA polymerase subunit sigma [Clostridiales bacterium]